jgi:hypothetical protein
MTISLTKAGPGGSSVAFTGASISGNGTAPDGNGNYTSVLFSTVDKDSGGYADVANERVVAQDAGTFRLAAGGTFSQGGAATPTSVDLRILIGGVQKRIGSTSLLPSDATYGFANVAIEVPVTLAVGDVVTAEIRSQNGPGNAGAFNLAYLSVIKE